LWRNDLIPPVMKGLAQGTFPIKTLTYVQII